MAVTTSELIYDATADLTDCPITIEVGLEDGEIKMSISGCPGFFYASSGRAKIAVEISPAAPNQPLARYSVRRISVPLQASAGLPITP